MNKNSIVIAITVIGLVLAFIFFCYELLGFYNASEKLLASVELDTSLWVGVGTTAVGPPSAIFAILYLAGLIDQKQATQWGWVAFVISLLAFLIIGFVGMKAGQYRLEQAGYVACMNPKFQPGGFLKWASSLIYEKSTCEERDQKPFLTVTPQ